MQFENKKESKGFPLEFIRKMEAIPSLDSRALLESLEQEAHIAVRHHPEKKYARFERSSPIPWSRYGEYLENRPRFIHDPLFHAGAYYVQDAASQFLEHLFSSLPERPSEPLVLDLSAAPGGKSTHLLSLMEGKGLLLANEVNRKRYQILNENLVKWGFDNYLSTSIDPSRLASLGPIFDIVMVDAPCSGEGLFRKDLNARKEWSIDNVRLCEQRQTRILGEAQKNVKAGGFLIYSTCTFEKEENEEQVKRQIKNGFVPVNEAITVPSDWGIEEVHEGGRHMGFRFYPHLTRSEGFFISVLRKRKESEEGCVSYRVKGHSKSLGETVDPKILKPYFTWKDELSFFNLKGKIISIPARWENPIFEIVKKIPAYKIGAEMGQFKGSDFIPAHDLVLHRSIQSQFPSFDLSREKALLYLSRQTLNPVNLPAKGWIKMKFQGAPLGWIKALPGRINNYFPSPYRIRRI